ncbi:MAG: C39 family peptidase [Paenibacillaceae bacterium]
MKTLFSVFVYFVCLTVIGCSDQNQKPKFNAQQEKNEERKGDLAHVGNKSSRSDMIIVGTDSHSKQPRPINTAPGTAKETIILDIPIIKQNPELKYGCEVTSLAMVLKHAGVETNKLKLADELPKDDDPVQKTKSGDITRWGNPDHGFVGDITGKTAGYAVYAGPLEKLMNQYLKNRTVNLTRKSFDKVLVQIKKGKPVILWTTGDYKVPDRWESWKHGNEKINTPLDLHAVVLVGFDKDNIYINDPLSGKKAKKIKKDSFLKSWIALGQQALSYN